MKKLFLLCLIASSAAYSMNESGSSSSSDSKKEQNRSGAPMSEDDFRREMLALKRERLELAKQRHASREDTKALVINTAVATGAGASLSAMFIAFLRFLER